MKKEQTKNSVIALLIIVLYFVLPYLTSMFLDSNLANAITSIIFAIVIIFIYRKSFINDFKDFGKNRWKYVKSILLNLVIILTITIIINSLLVLVFNITDTSENDYSLRTMYESSPIVLFLLTAIYYPIVEGIVFRKTIKEVIDKKWLFIIFSSLFYFFFNVAYTSFTLNNILSSLCYFFIMIVLSNYYWKTNNLTASILVISLSNIITYFIVM
jgi:membrane protease YdiL (CAAX protease family)